jgi:hypothetical protein
LADGLEGKIVNDIDKPVTLAGGEIIMADESRLKAIYHIGTRTTHG